jgi:hypothetical protein
LRQLQALQVEESEAAAFLSDRRQRLN